MRGLAPSASSAAVISRDALEHSVVSIAWHYVNCLIISYLEEATAI